MAAVEEVLPPGMIPSCSREDIVSATQPTVSTFRGVWQAKVGTMHQSDVVDMIVLPKKTRERDIPSPYNSNTATAASAIPSSLSLSSPSVFQIDLESEDVSDSRSGTARIKVAGPLWQQLSPWKRRNKVAPSPQHTPSKVSMATTLQFNSDPSLLVVEKENASPRTVRQMNKSFAISDRPISAPVHKDDHGRAIGLYSDSGDHGRAIGLYSDSGDHGRAIGLYSDSGIFKTCPQDLSPEYSKIKKIKQPKSPQQPPPVPPRQDEGRVRYIEAYPLSSSPVVETGTSDVIRVLSQSPLSADQDSLYESLQDETEELYSEVVEFTRETGEVQLLSIQGQVPLVTSVSHSEGSFVDTESSQMQPIHYAAAKGDKGELEEVLSLLPIIQDPLERVLGSDKFCLREGVDMRDGEGRTALMYAVHHNHLECVQILARVGANINLEAPDGSTCLHEAAYSGTLKMIALLLSLGADGMKKDNDGRVPLHWCSKNHNPNCLSLFLDKVPGLTSNISDSTHMTPLMWAGFYGRSENVELLKQKGGDIRLVDCEGMRAIHWSAKSHDLRTLQVLVSPESAGYQDLKGRTVIHYVAKEGFSKAVSIIKGTRPLCVNDQDHNGRTSLHWAAVCEKPDVIRALLAAGADPNVKDIHGSTALDYALQKHLPYCALLLTQGQQMHQESSSYEHVLTLGESTGIGVRTLLQQEGKVLDQEVGKDQLTAEHVLQIKAVCTGAWINKFTTGGKGPMHPRFLWIDPTTMKLRWSKTMEARYISSRDTKRDHLLGVRLSASTAILRRKDFDPVTKHKFAFTIFTKNKVLDVVALSSEDFKTWLNGLQLLLHLGSEKALKVINGRVSLQD